MPEPHTVQAQNRPAAKIVKWLAIAALGFGLATVLSGGRALFGDAEARAAVGQAVPFVLWFNFLAGFAYLLAGAGLLARQRWAVPAALLIAGCTLLVFGAFGLHVLGGGGFERRTVAAMGLRSLFWIAVAILSRSALRSNALAHPEPRRT